MAANKDKNKVPLLSIPPRYTSGNLTEGEKTANNKRSCWEWRQRLKAKGWKMRNFYYPKEDDEKIVEFVKKCQREWEERKDDEETDEEEDTGSI